MRAMEVYRDWRQNTYFDDAFRAELDSIEGDVQEIEDRFYKDLEFGTAGMRGIIGAGTNRINVYIIRKATQGFANFLNKRFVTLDQKNHERAIAIAYDSRHMSYEFALETALVMAGNGFKTYLFDGVRTTPELSFAVRYLKCTGGVMITASHNPPEYNGYKVYDETGCQLVPDLADALVEEVNQVKDFDSVKYIDKKEALAADLLNHISDIVDEPYITMVKGVSLRPELLMHSDLKVVYTPLHGTGGETVKRTLKEMSFSGLIPVAEQMEPDGDFPTCNKPNPEEVEAFDLAIAYAEKYDADIAIATDPDCDRIGILIKDQNHYKVLSGNQIGSLYVDYILSSKKDIEPGDYIVNTIVTSNLASLQAEVLGVKTIQTLTGFKFIGEQIQLDRDHFILGYEESYGYNFSTEVRDKDAVQGTLIAIEMTEFYKRQGLTLQDKLNEIYEKHGYFIDETISQKYEGKSGLEEMNGIMTKIRKADGSLFPYSRKIDYLNDETGLPKSNVLKFYIDESSWFVFRPSGTEPKLKIYFSISDRDQEAAKKKFAYYHAMIMEKISE